MTINNDKYYDLFNKKLDDTINNILIDIAYKARGDKIDNINKELKETEHYEEFNISRIVVHDSTANFTIIKFRKIKSGLYLCIIYKPFRSECRALRRVLYRPLCGA